MRIIIALILELVSEEPSRIGICQDSDGVPQTRDHGGGGGRGECECSLLGDILDGGPIVPQS